MFEYFLPCHIDGYGQPLTVRGLLPAQKLLTRFNDGCCRVVLVVIVVVVVVVAAMVKQWWWLWWCTCLHLQAHWVCDRPCAGDHSQDNCQTSVLRAAGSPVQGGWASRPCCLLLVPPCPSFSSLSRPQSSFLFLFLPPLLLTSAPSSVPLLHTVTVESPFMAVAGGSPC
jgi:hypothetical protein